MPFQIMLAYVRIYQLHFEAQWNVSKDSILHGPRANYQTISNDFSCLALPGSLGEMVEARCPPAGKGESQRESQRLSSFSHQKESNTGPVQEVHKSASRPVTKIILLSLYWSTHIFNTILTPYFLQNFHKLCMTLNSNTIFSMAICLILISTNLDQDL